jgi:hypothetical protein
MKLKLNFAFGSLLMGLFALNSFAADCGKAVFDAAVNQAARTDDVYAESCTRYSQSENEAGSFYQYYIVISCEKEMGTESAAFDVRVNSDCTEVFADPHVAREDQ